MSNARNLADIVTGNFDVPLGALDNIDLSSRVAKTGDTMTGNLNQVKSMTSQYDGIGVLMGSSTANTNRSATFLQHSYIDAGGNQGNYVYNHSLRQTDGAYIANVYTVDYSAGVHSWYNPNGGLSGNTVMSIDSEGRVTMPYQPMCWVVLNGQTTTAGATFTTNSLNTNAGNCWNSSTHRFTAPVTGYYHCTAGLYTNYTSSYGYWAFFKNGGSFGSYHFNHGNYIIHEGMGATAIIYCVAGDYIQMGRPGGGGGYFDRVDLSVFLCG